MWRVLNSAITKVFDVMGNVVGVTLMAFETLDPQVPVALLGYMLHQDILHLTLWHTANSAHLFIKCADASQLIMSTWLQRAAQFVAVRVEPTTERIVFHDVSTAAFDDLATQFDANPYRLLATPVADGTTAATLVTMLRQWRGMLPDLLWDEETLAESQTARRSSWKEQLAAELSYPTPGCTCHMDFALVQCFENHRTCSTCMLRLVQAHVNMLREVLQDPHGTNISVPRITCPHAECKQIFTVHWLTTKAVELDVDLLKSVSTLQGLQKQLALYQSSC